MKDLRTLILAAGKGTRMKSAKPKVLHEIFGRPLIAYVLDVARAAGSLKTYVVLGHQIDMVRSRLPREAGVIHQQKLLGTADAVRCARRELAKCRGDVLILCGDTVLLRKETVRKVVQQHRRKKAACTFLTAEVENSFGYGRVIRNAVGAAVAIREEKDATPEEQRIREINVGVYCFKAEALLKFINTVPVNAKKKEFYLTDLAAMFTRHGLLVETVKTDDAGEGLGINTRAELAMAAEIIRLRILNKLMADGVTIVDPKTTHVYCDVKIGPDTVVRPFTVIENNVVIGKNCVIGPFAHLRPGTRLGDNVEIGNFAEVSRSKLGTGCLQKHFSFVGDAEVGCGTNIGAGTVTANYDGKNKNKTRIGKKVFIGSDSILVAPVVIGDGAMTGAGCVVKKNTVVPQKGVVVGVPARLIRKV